MMKKSILHYVSPLFFLLLFAACTQNELNLDTAQNEEATARSTQAECDSIQDNLPDESTSISEYCMHIAELLECRLNQGVDEAAVMANCTAIDSYNFNECINRGEIIFNYNTVVDNLQQRVSDNSSDCTGGCGFPDPIIGCRTIIFTVGSSGSGPCGDDCFYSLNARIYCCQ